MQKPGMWGHGRRQGTVSFPLLVAEGPPSMSQIAEEGGVARQPKPVARVWGEEGGGLQAAGPPRDWKLPWA